jgi:hypothetical protein
MVVCELVMDYVLRKLGGNYATPGRLELICYMIHADATINF